MSTFWLVVIITAIAGVCGTGLGGFLGVVLTRDSSKMISLLLAFAAGVMMAVVCFDLIPTSFMPEGATSQISIWFVVTGVIIGYAVVYALNNIIDKKTDPEVRPDDDSHPRTADDLDELIHADHLHLHRHKKKVTGSNAGLFGAGVVMACAIALHNMPEGMVIGASYAGSSEAITAGSGFIIAIVIGLHNIPEGMAVSVPLVAGGMSKSKAVLITALSGVPTIIGAMLGYSLGLLSPVWLSLSLSFASGAMSYVVLGELLPESYLMWRSKAPGAAALVGMLLGIVLVKF